MKLRFYPIMTEIRSILLSLKKNCDGAKKKILSENKSPVPLRIKKVDAFFI